MAEKACPIKMFIGPASYQRASVRVRIE